MSDYRRKTAYSRNKRSVSVPKNTFDLVAFASAKENMSIGKFIEHMLDVEDLKQRMN